MMRVGGENKILYPQNKRNKRNLFVNARIVGACGDAELQKLVRNKQKQVSPIIHDYI
jgi:hypothetical protein